MRFSIVTACNNATVLINNLLKSPHIYEHDLHIKFGFKKPCEAYNEAIKNCKEDIIIFVHQDVYLPESFFGDLTIAIGKLFYANWGVLGVAGKQSEYFSANVLDRGRLLKTNDLKPSLVDTLDELLLVVKKSSFNKISFDENIPNHHLFGTDLCLQAIKRDYNNYVIDAYCEHNSLLLSLPDCYHVSEEYIKNKWELYLPIHTTCSIIR
jgi:hypothetical protein